MKRAICMILVLLFAVTACAAKNEDPVPSPAWAQAVADMTGARQVVLVAAKEGSEAEFTMHEKDEDGNWHVLVSAPAIIGKNGLGKTKVGDMKTPQGVYTLGFAFGIKEDPGCRLAYHQVTEYDYWSGDQWNRYNEMVDIRDCPSLDVRACEHLIDMEPSYHYCLNIGYNPESVPEAGAALFLHCRTPEKSYTAGCVAIPEEDMIAVMQSIKAGCIIVIESEDTLTAIA